MNSELVYKVPGSVAAQMVRLIRSIVEERGGKTLRRYGPDAGNGKAFDL